MTTQEAYERMRVYFSRPGAKRALAPGHWTDDDEPVCVYRTPDGDACAAGCLIPDELYTPAIERSSAGVLFTGQVPVRNEDGAPIPGEAINIPEIAAFLADIDVKFLDEAQHLHDRANVSYYKDGDWVEEPNTVTRFLTELDALAEKTGLDVARAKALCVAACPED